MQKEYLLIHNPQSFIDSEFINYQSEL